MAKKGQELYRNVISWLGGLVVLGFVLLIFLTVLFQAVSGEPNPYIGIFSYMVFPAFVGLGIVIFLYGMRRESLRRRRAGTTEALPYPHLDLNEPRQRKWFGWALVGGGLFGAVMIVAGYHAFEFTESVTFCGDVCHTVMEPERTGHASSPHARVPCVSCHVGPGAGWYVKSKWSGLRQVVAVTLDTYERPIPTPIANLRPARETCEQCHWPEKFFGAQMMQIPHFRPDEKNTADQVSLLLKTGGGNPSLGGNAGIHWHMILSNRITYRAEEAHADTIPWIRVQHSDGTEEEYTVQGAPVAPDALQKMPERIVDCIECHNRPSHIFPPFEVSVNKAMEARSISPALPWIKKVAVEALQGTYDDKEAAKAGIRKQVEAFYQARGNTGDATAKDLAQAVETLTGIWTRSVFPQMNVDPTTYPMNIGHRNWNGCFRCHDGRHVTREGKVLTRECTACHTAPERGPLAPLGASLPVAGGEWHPILLKGAHERAMCTKCHGPSRQPPAGCATCHKLDAKAPMMDDCNQCHTTPGEARPTEDCKTCHDSVAELHEGDAHSKATCATCHPLHRWNVPDREACLSCHKDRKDHHPEGACKSCHAFRAEKKVDSR